MRSYAWGAFALLSLALSAWCFVVARPSKADIDAIALWLPDAASRSAAQSLDELTPNSYREGTMTTRPGVKAAASLGNPSPHSQTLFAPTSPPRIDQLMLVRSTDNKYFLTTFSWHDDPIVGGCVEHPQMCSRYDWPREVSEAEARTLLQQSSTNSPALADKLFTQQH